MDIEKIASKKRSFAAKQVGGDLVLVPVKNNVTEMNEMFTLNEVGAFIWENLGEESTRETLSQSMIEEFDIEHDVARTDLDEFLGQLETMMND
ncbi:MAG: hypothetical protein ACI85F_000630 [Bacteroidia bacterium]|jgi:hypothetical protein